MIELKTPDGGRAVSAGGMSVAGDFSDVLLDDQTLSAIEELQRLEATRMTVGLPVHTDFGKVLVADLWDVVNSAMATDRFIRVRVQFDIGYGKDWRSVTAGSCTGPAALPYFSRDFTQAGFDLAMKAYAAALMLRRADNPLYLALYWLGDRPKFAFTTLRGIAPWFDPAQTLAALRNYEMPRRRGLVRSAPVRSALQ